jgi:hypothetical protein
MQPHKSTYERYARTDAVLQKDSVHDSYYFPEARMLLLPENRYFLKDTVYENFRMALIGDSIYFFFCQDSLFVKGPIGKIERNTFNGYEKILVFHDKIYEAKRYEIVGRKSLHCVDRRSLRLPDDILNYQVPFNACSQGFKGWPSNATVYRPDSIRPLSDSLEAAP